MLIFNNPSSSPGFDFLIVPCIFIGYKILKKNTIKGIIKEALLVGFIPFVVLIVLLPRFLFLWGAQGGSQFEIGYFGFRELWFTRAYTGGLVFPDVFFMPAAILIIFLIGFIQILLNWKKYFFWILSSLYFIALTYLLPIIIKDPYYFARARALTPYFIYPTVAYILYHLLKNLLVYIKKIKENYAILILSIIIITISLPGYIALVDSLQHEHITENEWQSYLWIQKNTPIDAKILFFGTATQEEYLYSKRITGVFNFEEYNRIITNVLQNNITATEFNGAWGGNTLRATRRYEISFFNYGEYDEPSNILVLDDFDYIWFHNINEQIMNINHYFASYYINNHRFRPVYEYGGVLILKNERN
jgi:hypothetical protein